MPPSPQLRSPAPGRLEALAGPRMIDRLHLVDGTYELFRAHYSKRPEHLTPDGKPAKATIGLGLSLLALLKEDGERATHVAVAFDNPIRSFRNRLFDGYK